MSKKLLGELWRTVLIDNLGSGDILEKDVERL